MAAAPVPPSLESEVVVTSPGGQAYLVGIVGARDRARLFAIFSGVVEGREGYPHEPPLTEAVFDSVWDAPLTTVVGAWPAPGKGASVELLGAYYLRPNFPGRASHIANAGYVVAPEARGHGVGRALVEDSIWRAPLAGFDSIQFNLVFVSNPARRLYESLGWQQIGRIPDAVEGDDALIYWRAVG